jgi:tRNA nucleotidyltransferase/poly(A) polymerase
LEFGIASDTEELIRRDAGLLATVSGERIRDELARMLLLPWSVDALKDLWRLGLLGELFPIPSPGVRRGLARLGHLEEVLAGEDVLPPPLAHPVRVWAGETMSGGRPRWVALRLSALLYGMGGEEWEEAKSALSRLHFSRRENALVRRVVEAQPLYAKVASSDEVGPLMAYRFFRDARGIGIGLILVGLADSLSQGVGASREASLQLLRYRFEEYSSVISPPQLVDGGDLLEELGLRPGPQVGRILEAVREAQVAGQVWDRQEALDLAREITDAARSL